MAPKKPKMFGLTPPIKKAGTDKAAKPRSLKMPLLKKVRKSAAPKAPKGLEQFQESDNSMSLNALTLKPRR